MAATDEFINKRDNGNGFTGGQAAVQNVDFAKVSRAIYIGASAAITLVMAEGNTLTFAPGPVGSTLYVRATKMTSANADVTVLW